MLLVPKRIGLVPLACLLGAIVIAGIASLTWTTSPYYGRSDAQPPVINVGAVPGEAPANSPAAKTIRSAPVAYVSPHRIVIPKLNAHAPIVKVQTSSDGVLEVPTDPKVVGWWSPGAKPGARKGTAIFAGHINYNGVSGTLAAIGTLHPGDAVEVYGVHRGRATKIDYAVTGVRTYHKTNLPYRQIFDQGGVGRLAIVTCGGPFDASTGNYLDNIVTFAVPR